MMGLHITKFLVDNGEEYTMKVSYDGELLDILNFPKREDINLDAYLFLQYYYIDVPAPFKKGDILEYAGRDDGDDDGIFVLDYMFSDEPALHERLLSHRSGDITDMNAMGYKKLPLCDFYYDHITTYTNLQYFRGKLEGEGKILEYLSLYLKNEFNLDILVALKNKVMLEKVLRSGENFLSAVLESGYYKTITGETDKNAKPPTEEESR
jgi:hypothetical protein